VCEEILKKYYPDFEKLYGLSETQSKTFIQEFSIINEGSEFESEQKAKSWFISFLKNSISKGSEQKQKNLAPTRKIIKLKEEVDWSKV